LFDRKLASVRGSRRTCVGADENADWKSLKDRYDVVVVGSGAGGSTLAYQLTKAGLRVLMVEQGEFLRPQWRNASDLVGKYQYHLVNGGRPVQSFVGGQTKFYGSALYRMRECDFRPVEHEKGISPGWPFKYSDLERYYEQAEALYRVHGSANDDPTEPPRVRPFPHPPIEHQPIVSEVVGRLKDLGAGVSAIPLGLDYGPGGKCILCSTCDAHYCQLDAKMDAEIAALRPAIATGNLQLMTGAECRRVLTTREGSRVSGVVLRQAVTERVVAAYAVAVCDCGHASALLKRR